MGKFLKHLFYPHEQNNFRAKLLHLDSLLIIIFILIFITFGFNTVKTNLPSVLGISTGMTAEQLLILTNEKRIENGLSPLTLNSQLSAAAENKAIDMFNKNYWAHNSPDGTTPWVFINNTGYTYVYAGENLARGFNSSSDVINAWMASEEHRQNILSANYKDIGFAIKTGSLTGEDTVLVVEMFGTGKAVAKAQPAQEITPQPTQEVKKVEEPKLIAASLNQQNIQGSQAKPFFNSKNLSKNIVLAIIYILILALIIDVLVIEKKKIVRFVGHNIDHILFLLFVLALILLFTRGFVM